MKNLILAITCITLFYSFNIDSNKTCFTAKEIKSLKSSVKSEKFFHGYHTNRVDVWGNSELNKNCLGLFFICLKSKDNIGQIYVPCIKGTKTTLFNPYIYEGRKILKDTSGINSKLQVCLKEIENEFTKVQIDSIKNEFIYGVYFLSGRYMKGN